MSRLLPPRQLRRSRSLLARVVPLKSLHPLMTRRVLMRVPIVSRGAGADDPREEPTLLSVLLKLERSSLRRSRRLLMLARIAAGVSVVPAPKLPRSVLRTRLSTWTTPRARVKPAGKQVAAVTQLPLRRASKCVAARRGPSVLSNSSNSSVTTALRTMTTWAVRSHATAHAVVRLPLTPTREDLSSRSVIASAPVSHAVEPPMRSARATATCLTSRRRETRTSHSMSLRWEVAEAVACATATATSQDLATTQLQEGLRDLTS